jgi:hypothetical protein
MESTGVEAGVCVCVMRDGLCINVCVHCACALGGKCDSENLANNEQVCVGVACAILLRVRVRVLCG